MNRKFTYLVIFKYKISEFSINMQKLLYSYWDTEGKGINLTYLTTYSDKLIFDSYNRSFFTEGKTFGNHFVGSYHGEVFNDFEHNSAYADYSSVHGHHNVVQNESEVAFGKYNNSTKGKTVFSVGYGNESSRSNIFELQNTGVAYVKNDIYSGNISFKDTYSYLGNAYSYSLTYSQNIGNKLDNTYSYIYKNYPSVIPNSNYSKLYIWTGTSSELPPIENRFKNVIYIVTNEQETELPEYKG